MLKFVTRIVITSILAAGMATAVLAAPPVAIDSRQLNGSAPATFRIRITLEPNAQNRYLCLQWVQVKGGGNEKTSCWSVQAEREAKTTWKELRDLPAGKYAVRAYVVRNDEQGVLSNELTLHVIGFGYDLD